MQIVCVESSVAVREGGLELTAGGWVRVGSCLSGFCLFDAVPRADNPDTVTNVTPNIVKKVLNIRNYPESARSIYSERLRRHASRAIPDSRGLKYPPHGSDHAHPDSRVARKAIHTSTGYQSINGD